MRSQMMRNQPEITLRRATSDDARLLFSWINDQEIRQMSFSSAAISWEEHSNWFSKKLDDSNCVIYLAFNEDQVAVGQVRFDKTAVSEAEIAIYTNPTMRSKGYGTKIIETGVKQIVEELSIERVHALIKPENAKSLRAFEKAGFVLAGKQDVGDITCWHLVKNSHDSADV